MKKPNAKLVRLCLACAALLALGSGAHGADESDLPGSLRSDYVHPILGPADDHAYAHGTLGLIRTSYGRASLFVAWRVMHLPVGAVATESHERRGSWLYGELEPAAGGGDEIAAWLAARAALAPTAPAVKPDYYRHAKIKVAGAGEYDQVEGQCGPDAYAFATRTLADLVADTALKDADRRSWIAAQDAVFARCSWMPGKTPAPALPTPPAKTASAKLKALYAYQHAAALFYGDDFGAARKEFDAIAALPKHPMRAWATLAALRCLLRETVRDAEWEAAVTDAWTRRQLRGEAYGAAIADPAARRRTRVNAALQDFDTRAKAAIADTTLAPVHAAVRYTTRRAVLQLAPILPLNLAMNALDRPEASPYAMGALDLFQDLYPSVALDRPEGARAAQLRKHEWFDFIVTVQACDDTTHPLDPAICDAEHAHALARWQETKDGAWLLATLMTARQPSALDLPAAEAARAFDATRPERISLQFYAARVLRALGRGADSKALLDALGSSPAIHKRDRPLLESERRL